MSLNTSPTLRRGLTKASVYHVIRSNTIGTCRGHVEKTQLHKILLYTTICGEAEASLTRSPLIPRGFFSKDRKLHHKAMPGKANSVADEKPPRKADCYGGQGNIPQLVLTSIHRLRRRRKEEEEKRGGGNSTLLYSTKAILHTFFGRSAHELT